MIEFQHTSTKETLQVALQKAFAWANNQLLEYGFGRRLWTCPKERRFVAEQVLNLCKIDAQKAVRINTKLPARIESCEFYIHDLNITDLGGLLLQQNTINLGKSSADVELHLFVFNEKSIDSEITSFCKISDEGWKITAKFLGSSPADGDFPIAIMACRAANEANIAIDQSLYTAYDLMRIAAIKHIKNKTTQRLFAQQSTHSLESATHPELISTLKLAANHQLLGIHKIQSQIGMRVGFYVSSFASFGGLEQWVLNMAFALIQVGVNPIIICANDKEVQERFPRELIQCLVLLEGDASKIKAAVEKEQIDVLIVNHIYDALDTIVEEVKIVEVIHNIYFWQKNNIALKLLRSRFARIICISDVVQHYTESYLGVSPKLITLIEHGLDKSGLYRPFADYLEKSDQPDKFRIVCVANVYPQKNILLLVKAFNHAFGSDKNAYLDIAGGTPHLEFFSSINNYLETSDSKEQVVIHGSVDRIRLSKILSNGSIFCLPSLYEGFGLATLEAMYFGLPTVLSNTGHSKKLAERAGGLIVDVAAKLEDLSEEKALLSAMEPLASDVEKLSAALQTVRANLPHFRSRALENAYSGSIRTIDDTADDYAELLHNIISA
jgi:glycosyltransferase involved in cell wall biosynthesis